MHFKPFKANLEFSTLFKYNLKLDYQTLKKAHFLVKQKIADECKMGNFSQNTTKIGGYLHENLEKPIPHSGNFSPTFIIMLWLDWALFLTCTLF